MILQDSGGAAITAAGTTQGTATELLYGLSFIATAASGSGVVLKAGALTGDMQLVYNGGANAVKVYPNSGSKINNLSTNSAHILAPNTACEYWFVTDTQIAAILSA